MKKYFALTIVLAIIAMTMMFIPATAMAEIVDSEELWVGDVEYVDGTQVDINKTLVNGVTVEYQTGKYKIVFDGMMTSANGLPVDVLSEHGFIDCANADLDITVKGENIFNGTRYINFNDEFLSSFIVVQNGSLSIKGNGLVDKISLSNLVNVISCGKNVLLQDISISSFSVGFASCNDLIIKNSSIDTSNDFDFSGIQEGDIDWTTGIKADNVYIEDSSVKMYGGFASISNWCGSFPTSEPTLEKLEVPNGTVSIKGSSKVDIDYGCGAIYAGKTMVFDFTKDGYFNAKQISEEDKTKVGAVYCDSTSTIVLGNTTVIADGGKVIKVGNGDAGYEYIGNSNGAMSTLRVEYGIKNPKTGDIALLTIMFAGCIGIIAAVSMIFVKRREDRAA